MNIVLEGPDGGGKSTLATHLLERFERISERDKRPDAWRVQHSGGPAKSTEEIEARTRAYLGYSRVIFDRHPTISNPIYSTIFNGIPGPTDHVIAEFYASKPVLIYCRSKDASRHEVKENDHAARFLDQLPTNYARLVYLYDIWAAEHAHFIYRIGDDLEKFIRSVEARIW